MLDTFRSIGERRIHAVMPWPFFILDMPTEPFLLLDTEHWILGYYFYAIATIPGKLQTRRASVCLT